MNKIHLITNTFFAVLCTALINTKSFAEPANIGQLKTELRIYHDTGRYENEIGQVILDAKAYINARANENSQEEHPKKLAIVLDIDETSLSNYDDLNHRDFSDDFEQIHQSFAAGHATPIRPMLDLYQDAQAHHVAVFFVTGREQRYRQATERNLTDAGYHDWSGLYFKQDDKMPTVIYKTTTRAAITKQGYTIIASIGDQFSDLLGGYAEKTFKLPNPYYHIP